MVGGKELGSRSTAPWGGYWPVPRDEAPPECRHPQGQPQPCERWGHLQREQEKATGYQDGANPDGQQLSSKA